MNSAACASAAARADLGVGRVRAAEADVVGDRAVEHRRVLRHVARWSRGERPAGSRAMSLAADEDRAALDVHEPEQQPGERRLAAARAADESDLLARRRRAARTGRTAAAAPGECRKRIVTKLDAVVARRERHGLGRRRRPSGGSSSSSVNCAASVSAPSRLR